MTVSTDNGWPRAIGNAFANKEKQADIKKVSAAKGIRII